jgi:hypothetical protein
MIGRSHKHMSSHPGTNFNQGQWDTICNRNKESCSGIYSTIIEIAIIQCTIVQVTNEQMYEFVYEVQQSQSEYYYASGCNLSLFLLFIHCMHTKL